MKEKVAVYAGTFDPVTNGHLDVIERGARLFDKLYVVIPNNTNKTPVYNSPINTSFLVYLFFVLVILLSTLYKYNTKK